MPIKAFCGNVEVLKLRNNHGRRPDVKKFFVATIQEFLQLATEGKLLANYEDISLQPAKSPYYSMSKAITDNEAYKSLTTSDMDAVLQRMAEQAAHRHKHLEKNNEKTRLKIKNH